jgi:hypothetical protein
LIIAIKIKSTQKKMKGVGKMEANNGSEVIKDLEIIGEEA